jgi:hypothetical protein
MMGMEGRALETRWAERPLSVRATMMRAPIWWATSAAVRAMASATELWEGGRGLGW